MDHADESGKAFPSPWPEVVPAHELTTMPVAGWEQLLRAITESPLHRFIPTRRHMGIEILASALQELPIREAFILLLRYGLASYDHNQSERSRREVSEMLELSVSRVAHLERDGLAQLRQSLIHPESSLLSCIDEDRAMMDDHLGHAMV